MSQPAPPPDPNAPRPLPRRPVPRPSSPRIANRPRFGTIDAVWMVILAGLSLALSYHWAGFGGSRTLGALCAAGTVAASYLLGWRARDRAAGVSAGLLAATSQAFLFGAAYSPQSAAFTLLTISALFAFVAGSSLAALALAAGATLVRPDGLLLGLLLLGVALVQHRRRALWGVAVFFVPLFAAWIGPLVVGSGLPSLPRFGLHLGPLLWLWTPATALLAWLLLPFCAELGEPLRRARWLPVVLWAVLAFASASLLSDTTPTGMRLPLLPLLFVLAGGGLSRLLPTLAGEFPSPAIRYVLAVLAVLGLVGLHIRLEPQTAPGLNTPAAPARHSR